MTEVSARARRRGTLCVCTASMLYSIGGLFIKMVPWNAMSINAGRNFIAACVIGIYLLLTHQKLRMNRSILLGAVAYLGSQALFAAATKMTTAANAIVLEFTAPVFVILFTLIFWKRKPDKVDILACIAVFAGVTCFFLDSLEVGGTAGNLIALASGVTTAVFFLLRDMPDSDPISSVFWGEILCVLVGMPFVAQETDFSMAAVGCVLILGFFQVGIAYILMCIGLKTTPALTASLTNALEPIFNPVWVAIFWDEKLSWLALVGGIIVIGSIVCYNVLKTRQKEAKT